MEGSYPTDKSEGIQSLTASRFPAPGGRSVPRTNLDSGNNATVNKYHPFQAAFAFLVIPAFNPCFLKNAFDFDFCVTPVLVTGFTANPDDVAAGIACSDQLAAATVTVRRKIFNDRKTKQRDDYHN